MAYRTLFKLAYLKATLARIWNRAQAKRSYLLTASASRNEQGVALFMVLTAMTVLALMVTEFTYTAQVNQRMSLDGADQLQAHYLAKTGLKISLIRLKAYQLLKNASGGAAGAGVALPKKLLEAIWSQPFQFPIPADLPGLSRNDRDMIQKFKDTSGLNGQFITVIQSESSKLNLNMVLAPFAPNVAPSPAPSAGPTPQPSFTFSTENAKETLGTFLTNVIENKSLSDEEFLAEYRDVRVDDLVEAIVSWADANHQGRGNSREFYPAKQAPFSSVSELRMIYPIDDKLYDLLSPQFTATTTPGVNVNSLTEIGFQALVPGTTAEEAKEFVDYRDDIKEDHLFKTDADFFKYLEQKVPAFRGDAKEVSRFRDGLTTKGIRIVTDETEFRINVSAKVNNATRTIEAWVSLIPPKNARSGARASNPTPGATPTPNPTSTAPPLSGAGRPGANENESGLKITFMRIL